MRDARRVANAPTDLPANDAQPWESIEEAEPASLEKRRARAFFRVWAPSLTTVIGTGLCTFAINWWVGQSPNGGAYLGVIVGVASGVSLLSVVALSGLVDRADRRRTLVRLLLGMVVPAGILLAVFGFEPDLVLAVVVAGLCYVLVVTLQTLYMATMETIAVDLAPSNWPASRTALLTQLHPQIERIAAPAIAGVLVTAGVLRGVPVATLFIIGAVLFAVFAVRHYIDGVTSRTALRARQDSTGRPLTGSVALRMAFRDSRGALRLIRSHRELQFLVLLGLLANAVVFPFYVILPAFLTEYELPVRDHASLYARGATVYGIGLLTGTLLLLRYRRPTSSRRGLLLASMGFLVICSVLVVATIVPQPEFIIVAMGVSGALFSVVIAMAGALWLRCTPADIRVRVFSLRRLIVFSSVPIGSMLMGFGGAAMGYRQFTRSMVIAIAVVLAAAWLVYRRWLRNDDNLILARSENNG